MTQNPSRYVKYLQAQRITEILERNHVTVSSFSIEREGMTILAHERGYGISGVTVTVDMNVHDGGAHYQLQALADLVNTVSDPVEITVGRATVSAVGLSSTGVAWRVYFYRLKPSDPQMEGPISSVEELAEMVL